MVYTPSLSHFPIVLGAVYWWYRPPVAGIALPSLVSPSSRWYRPPTLENFNSQTKKKIMTVEVMEEGSSK